MSTQAVRDRNARAGDPDQTGIGEPARMRRPLRRRRGAGSLGFLLAAIVVSSLPYLYGHAIRPDGTRFWSVPPLNSQDANAYLAFARTIADGQWLVGNRFTPEPHVPRLFVPTAVLQAALCRAFGWTPLTAFHITRVVFGVCLLLAAWWLGSLLIRRQSLQRLYMGFVCFSAGGGWLVDLVRPGTAHGDRHQPEGNTIFLLGNMPHLILAAALLTALFATRVALGRGRPSGGAGLLAATVSLSFLLSWTHPWDFVPLVLGTGAYGLFLLAEDRRLPWVSVVHLAAVGIGALPAAAYLTWVVSSDPMYAAMANDVMQVQRWPFYLIAHGVLALPAMMVLAHPTLRSRYALPLCWVLCVFLFLFTPFRMGGKQSRLPGGVHVPLALLAAVGVEHVARTVRVSLEREQRRRPETRRVSRSGVLSRIRPAVLQRGICVGYLGLAALGGVAIVHRHWSQYVPRSPADFQSAGVQQLYEYLDGAGSADEVALGGPLTAGWAPALADTRSYHGHWHLTIDERGKRAARDWFFSSAAGPDERAAWLSAHGISWVIWYPWEWNRTILPLDDVPGLQRVFTHDDISLYRYEARD